MKNNPAIVDTVNEVVKICSPFQVFLVSHRKNEKGELASFKLCVIVKNNMDIKKIEADIMVNINCSVPFNVIIYAVSEWNDCIDDDCSFAYRVENEGNLIYQSEVV